MRRSIILLLVLTVALALAAVPVSAGPPTPAEGHWTYVLTSLDPPKQVGSGPNTFLHGTDLGTWTGTFDGSTVEEFVVVCHPKKNGVVNNFYKGEMTFKGKVDGREGTMVIKTSAKQVSDTCEPSDAIWHGRWVIIGGTGELADVHGQGTFEGDPLLGDFLRAKYEGQIHFS